MQKSLIGLLSLLLLVVLSSCGECEDTSFQVSDNLRSWLPYEGESTITFTNPDNESRDYTLMAFETVDMEADGDCTKSFTRFDIEIGNDQQPRFLSSWLSYNEDLLGDLDQLWGIVRENEELVGSGLIRDLNNPDAVAISVDLNGQTYDEVIELELGVDSTITLVYFQKNIGLIAYNYRDTLWVAE